MSAPEHPGLVVRLDAHAASVPSPGPERDLRVRLVRKEIQLAAVIDRVTAQCLFMWLGLQDTSPTTAQIEARRREIRAEWVDVALAATNRKGPNR